MPDNGSTTPMPETPSPLTPGSIVYVCGPKKHGAPRLLSSRDSNDWRTRADSGKTSGPQKHSRTAGRATPWPASRKDYRTTSKGTKVSVLELAQPMTPAHKLPDEAEKEKRSKEGGTGKKEEEDVFADEDDWLKPARCSEKAGSCYCKGAPHHQHQQPKCFVFFSTPPWLTHPAWPGLERHTSGSWHGGPAPPAQEARDLRIDDDGVDGITTEPFPAYVDPILHPVGLDPLATFTRPRAPSDDEDARALNLCIAKLRNQVRERELLGDSLYGAL